MPSESGLTEKTLAGGRRNSHESGRMGHIGGHLTDMALRRTVPSPLAVKPKTAISAIGGILALTH
jgi:hypothetical protein